MKAIYCDAVIDGLGGVIRSPSVILVDEDRIVDIVPQGDYTSSRDTEVIRLDGQTVLPGLFDLHVHLRGLPARDWRPEAFASDALRAARATNDLRLLIEAGITTVRDCGSTIALALRTAVNEGSIIGPRILAAGRFIERTGGTDDASMFLPLELAREGWGQSAVRLADGPDEIRRAVREQVRDGADLIKTCADGMADATLGHRRDTLEWSSPELETLVDEAHRLGRKVAVHAQSSAAAQQAVQCGADTIEHGFWLDAMAFEAMVENGTYLVPTLTSVQYTAERGEAAGMPAWIVSRAAEEVEGHRRVIREAFRSGVPIVMGSDCAGTLMYPFGDNIGEIEAMIGAGMPAMDALVASTSRAAKACGLETVGMIRPGAAADLIAVPRDPLGDPSALRDVSFVMKSGTRIGPGRATPRASQLATWLR